ncbi:MAG: helix-turn-helix transcriptional regulator [Chloroflexota bacterium]
MGNKSSLEKFGENVRNLRKEANLSQEDLAELCGLHRTYVGGIERGERNVALLNILRIAKALNVSPSKLFEGLE